MKAGHFFIGIGVLGACIILFSSFKKSDDKKVSDDKSSNEVDTTGMLDYQIDIPFSLQPVLFSNGQFYDLISKFNYSYSNDLVTKNEKGDEVIRVNIKVKPEVASEISNTVKKLSNEISIKQVA